jgi:arylsulfatase
MMFISQGMEAGRESNREAMFGNQKKLGVIPATAKLTPRPDGLPARDSLGFLVRNDEQTGRILDPVERSPEGDNTLIILALGDNRASTEGGLTGTVNNMATQNGFPDDVATMLKASWNGLEVAGRAITPAII